MPIKITARVEGDVVLALMFQKAGGTIRRRVWAKVRSVSFALVRRIKQEMPVDTGRARASWGLWTPGAITRYEIFGGSSRQRADIWQGNRASKEDAVFEQEESSLSVMQGTNVPYVARLNEGHSNQAPVGFIDKAATKAAALLSEAIRQVLQDVIR